MFYNLIFLLLGQTPPEQALLARVAKHYAQQGDITAEFTQTYTDVLRQKTRSESGTLWVTQEGKIRWLYTQPLRKDFIFDGTTAYFYEPDNAQVTIFEQFGKSMMSDALQFLWGKGDISHAFTVQPCKATACPTLKTQQVALQLMPKQAMPAVQYIILVVDKPKAQVVSSQLVDPLGNHTDYLLSNLKAQQKIDPNMFVFEIPNDINILRAP